MSADDRQVGGDHYQAMGVQPWAALGAWLTKSQFIGFLIGSAVAYAARFNASAPGKGGRQDIEKAIHCLEKALEVIDSSP